MFTVLKVSGPLSRRELARRVPDARGSMTAHLTHMQDAGWIELVEGDLRSGVWAIGASAMAWPSPGQVSSPELRSQIYRLDRLVSHIRFERVGQFITECGRGEWSSEWEDTMISRDYTITASPERVAKLEEELVEVIERFRAESRNASSTTKGDSVKNVLIYLYGFPGE